MIRADPRRARACGESRVLFKCETSGMDWGVSARRRAAGVMNTTRMQKSPPTRVAWGGRGPGGLGLFDGVGARFGRVGFRAAFLFASGTVAFVTALAAAGKEERGACEGDHEGFHRRGSWWVKCRDTTGRSVGGFDRLSGGHAFFCDNRASAFGPDRAVYFGLFQQAGHKR